MSSKSYLTENLLSLLFLCWPLKISPNFAFVFLPHFLTVHGFFGSHWKKTSTAVVVVVVVGLPFALVFSVLIWVSATVTVQFSSPSCTFGWFWATMSLFCIFLVSVEITHTQAHTLMVMMMKPFQCNTHIAPL